MVRNFKITLKIIGFIILTIYRKTEYFLGVNTYNFSKIKKILQYDVNA